MVVFTLKSIYETVKLPKNSRRKKGLSPAPVGKNYASLAYFARSFFCFGLAKYARLAEQPCHLLLFVVKVAQTRSLPELAYFFRSGRLRSGSSCVLHASVTQDARRNWIFVNTILVLIQAAIVQAYSVHLLPHFVRHPQVPGGASDDFASALSTALQLKPTAGSYVTAFYRRPSPRSTAGHMAGVATLATSVRRTLLTSVALLPRRSYAI
jgi:hypothetical protein